MKYQGKVAMSDFTGNSRKGGFQRKEENSDKQWELLHPVVFLCVQYARILSSCPVSCQFVFS